MSETGVAGDWQSMTGFGRATGDLGTGWRGVVEMRSVNHKGLEVRVRVHPQVLAWEHLVTRWVEARLGRGKVEVRVQIQRAGAGESAPPDPALVHRLRARRWLLRGLLSPLPAPELPATETSVGDPAGEIEDDVLAGLVARAVDELVATRVREGSALRDVVHGQLEAMAELRTALAAASEEEGTHRARELRARLDELAAEGLDGRAEERLAAETAHLLVRGDITEELDRIDAHLEAARDLTRRPSPVGRRLDVLAQELGREAHTASSKAVTPETKATALDLRHLVERLREQVQNIE